MTDAGDCRVDVVDAALTRSEVAIAGGRGGTASPTCAGPA